MLQEYTSACVKHVVTGKFLSSNSIRCYSRKEISHDNDAFSTSVDLRDSYDVENLQNFSNELA